MCYRSIFQTLMGYWLSSLITKIRILTFLTCPANEARWKQRNRELFSRHLLSLLSSGIMWARKSLISSELEDKIVARKICTFLWNLDLLFLSSCTDQCIHSRSELFQAGRPWPMPISLHLHLFTVSGAMLYSPSKPCKTIILYVFKYLLKTHFYWVVYKRLITIKMHKHQVI